ncbi:MAG: ABC transporter ATP-binding protein [Sandaracinaceae bacterium]|nr:ABC transporter ATP-binding protein [Sandaracinaceae bacterium]
MSILELHRVSRARGTGEHAVQALSGVDLVVRPGEVVLVEGPSGSGKTTLLTVSAGLLSPDQGDVLLAGERVVTLSASRRRAHRARAVGFVFQHPNLLSTLSARDNVLLGALIAGRERAAALAATDALFEELGIPHLAHRRPHALSGGEEQRVAVARALVHGPALVLADEPTASLDSASGRAVGEALAQMAHTKGVGVVIATHDPRLRVFGTRRLWMEDGCLAPVVNRTD